MASDFTILIGNAGSFLGHLIVSSGVLISFASSGVFMSFAFSIIKEHFCKADLGKGVELSRLRFHRKR